MSSFFTILYVGTMLLVSLIGYPILQVYTILSNRGVKRYVAIALAVAIAPIYVYCLLRLMDRNENSKAVALEAGALLFCIGFFVTPLLLLIAIVGRASRSRYEKWQQAYENGNRRTGKAHGKHLDRKC